ncbi:MAG: PDZ domain-containing protein [Porticoccaceae bacterium]|jgi:serine protease DegS|nr:PDZ domain-containing protein [Porticoccaceae bacterium]
MLSKRNFYSYFWPALCGLLFALLLVFVAPQRLGLTPSQPQIQETAPANLSDSWVGPVSYSGAVRRAAPSVVSIYASIPVPTAQNQIFDDPFFRRFFDSQSNQEQRDLNSGAGVVVSGEGYILTNRHIIEGADEILVVADGKQAIAQVVGVDSETDLAVLITDLEDLTAFTIADSNSVEVGDIVLAIGNPFGQGQTVTQGIVSATGRNIMQLSGYLNFLQTDAAINEGNSGGALIDAYGNLIGINTASTLAAEGISFTIPVDIAIEVLRQIVENGSVIRGWVGISAGELSTQDALALGLGDTRAMIVGSVEPNGPALSAGMEPGDILVGINGEDLIDGRQVQEVISGTRPGELLSFAVLREGRRLNIQVRAALLPSE